MHVSDGTPVAGKRSVSLSLWEPAPNVDWLEEDDREPEIAYLPNQLWLIGLGHLGQAYLWGLGLLSFSDDKITNPRSRSVGSTMPWAAKLLIKWGLI